MDNQTSPGVNKTIRQLLKEYLAGDGSHWMGITRETTMHPDLYDDYPFEVEVVEVVSGEEEYKD